MNYPNLLFDADDTLFDFPKASGLAFHELCRANDLPDTPEAFHLYETINRSLWDAFDRGEIAKDALTSLRFVRFLEALGLDRDPEKCDRDYLTALGAGVYPTPHAQEVCRTLAETHRLYLVTNAVASVQRSRLRGSAFAPCFSDVFISEEAGAAKPQRAYFDYVLARIPGADEENCLVIGDSPATDLLGANNAGLPCCWYNPGRLPRPAGLRIDWEIADLRELYKIV